MVACDNLPANGQAARAVVIELAGERSAELGAWVGERVSFVSTVVDRITPAAAPGDPAAAGALTGRFDAVPVVTEPFREWVLCGQFPAGRPPWEAAGALVVDDVGPYQRRKLWLLNGAHSLLAYVGLGRGHTTVAEAMGDPVCRAALDRWWDEATLALDGPGAGQQETAVYLAALVERFTNARIAHSLNQIAGDGSQKLPVRVLPVMRAAHGAGRAAPGAAQILAGWVAWVRNAPSPLADPRAEALRAAANQPDGQAVTDLLGVLDPAAGQDGQARAEVVDALAGLGGG